MTERLFYDGVVLTYLALAPVVFIALLFIPAPYGRYTRKSFGPSIDRRLGWVIMETPAAVGLAYWLFAGSHPITAISLAFLVIWEMSYVHRAFIYPFRTRGSSQNMTVFAALAGALFNVGNTYINGRFLFSFGPERTLNWLAHPAFLAGVALFAIGFVINRAADKALRELRRPGETGYTIPTGRLFTHISCPNFAGEIVQWSGWALACWSLPGFAFALFTAANLVPRALAHHRWYHATFSDYPRSRRAVVPYLL